MASHTTVPGEEFPSPQLMVAVKSAGVSSPCPAGSMNVAMSVMGPRATPWGVVGGTFVATITGTVICWSATLKLLFVAVSVVLPSVTSTENVAPLSASM